MHAYNHEDMTELFIRRKCTSL